MSVQKEEICKVDKGFTLLLTDIHIAILVGKCLLNIKHVYCLLSANHVKFQVQFSKTKIVIELIYKNKTKS